MTVPVLFLRDFVLLELANFIVLFDFDEWIEGSFATVVILKCKFSYSHECYRPLIFPQKINLVPETCYIGFRHMPCSHRHFLVSQALESSLVQQSRTHFVKLIEPFLCRQ